MQSNPQLILRLERVNATRRARQAMADEILRNPTLTEPLLHIAMEQGHTTAHKACWVLDFMFQAEPECLYPHLEFFTSGLTNLQDESSIRPVARICEGLARGCAEPGDTKMPPLNNVQADRMLSASFDWLIGPHKVAAKAYSMNTILYLGKEKPWAYEELRAILEKDYPNSSAAYKARARQVLKVLDKSA